MAKKKTTKKTVKKKVSKKVAVESYRHESATRKNLPTAKIAAEGTVPRVAKARYAYSAHLSPELRFDASGQSDRVTDIVGKAAAGNKLTKEEAEILRGVAANASQPWLEWSGRKEEQARGVFDVEPVALHIHERVSANAIVRAAKREDVQADLFADPKQEYREAIQFYKHDVDWANRVILGDSLEVMSSLAKRESLAERVQMVYMDPPYGIKFASNFQPEVGRRDVKEKESDLTREPEMVRAYRDTWELGVHSYLSYLRDRLIVARELLASSGSIFVQISDENLHRVRQIMDDVFGVENFCTLIVVWKTSSATSTLAATTCDYLLWYAKDRGQVKYRQLYTRKDPADPDSGAKEYKYLLMPNGETISATSADEEQLDIGERFRPSPTTSQSGSEATRQPVFVHGRQFTPGPGGWKTNVEGFERLIGAGRIVPRDKSISYLRKLNDFPVVPVTDLWTDCRWGFDATDKRYVVETNPAVIERCILMTTDPGDLVLDPTCGSGTSAFAAEKWGRRWITIDSSRVSVSIARQRMLTSFYERQRLSTDSEGGTFGSGVDPACNFVYESVPHITLRSIARNENLDPIIKNHDVILDDRLEGVNSAFASVDPEVRRNLVSRLAKNMQEKGLRYVSNGDRRRLLLPGTTREEIKEAFQGKSRIKAKHVDEYFDQVPSSGRFEHWQVPFDVDPEWPNGLRDAVQEYIDAGLQKRMAIDECIAANSEQEVLVDHPLVDPDVIRVSGPFTVEGVRPEELSLGENGEIFDPTPNQWEVKDGHSVFTQNASAYLDRMLQLISQDGITFPNNEHRKFALVERLEESDSAVHAEALWEGAEDGNQPNIAVAFGPQHGPVTASQVEDLIRASRRYDELVIAAFSFDGSSQAVIQESANPRLKIHMAHIRPDVSPGMDGLLKDSPKSQLFTVFGQPEIELHKEDSEVKVELLGVDIYSPLTGEITSSGAKKVAAWFLDSDYDGRCFCITQAFFPNQKAWDKIAKALGSSADAEAFDAYNGTISVPFEPGEHERIAVKVIDPRGNEVMAIRSLKDNS